MELVVDRGSESDLAMDSEGDTLMAGSCRFLWGGTSTSGTGVFSLEEPGLGDSNGGVAVPRNRAFVAREAFDSSHCAGYWSKG